MEPKYTYNGLLNRQKFYNRKITFFVEDSYKESEYQILFEKIFNLKHTDFFVSAMGGKENVIKAFNDNIDKNNSGFFYIVDGDFDIIINSLQVKSDNFYYLNRYNIESFLIDKDNIIRLFRYMKNIEIEDAENLIKYNDWKKITYHLFAKLFYYYAFIYWINLDESPSTISDKPHAYLDLRRGIPVEEKIDKKISDLFIYVKNRGIDVGKKLNEFQTKFSIIICKNEERLVCGKYLLHSLYIYLRRICNENGLSESIQEEDIRRYLLENIKVKYFDELHDKFVFSIQKLLK